MTEYTDEQREQTQAMVFLDTWGSTTYPPERWRDWKWSEDGAPEWLSERELEADRDQCVTVLHCGWGDVEPPKGYRVAYRYQCGERDCPDCQGTGHAWNPETQEPDERQGACPLCEGDRVIYWGEEWSVAIFAPAYSWTLDPAPTGNPWQKWHNQCHSLKEAWENIREELESVGLSRRSLVRVLRDLRASGVHHFDRRLVPFVGWETVKFSEV